METIKINTVCSRFLSKLESFEFSILALFPVYIPVQVDRDSRRQTIDIIIKIADRRANPTLSYVTWNIRVTQLECARNTAAVITGRAMGDSFSPMNPIMMRNIANDVDILGKCVSNSMLYSILMPFIRFPFAAPFGCLQFHAGSEGTIQSFNFNGGAGPYPPNMNYAICIRRRQGNSNIE